ncbi:MAG: hypothetical protein JXN64_13145, partial [Spirochaetes bacterium]|nr:hypothetical protein [Spirochaetota bacterium]
NTGELITLSDEILRAAEDELDVEGYTGWEQDLIEKAKEVLQSKNFLSLPNKYDIHEYSIMEDFCYSIENEEIQDKLLNKIRGSGAFRRFKDAVHELKIEDSWYNFRYEKLKQIAIEWLEENNIKYQ